MSNLRVFGCVAYVHVPDQQRTKLQPKARKCIFTGYPDDTKGYKLFDIETGKFVRSRNVLFAETEFHDFGSKTESAEWLSLFPICNSEATTDSDDDVQPSSTDDSDPVESETDSVNNNDSPAIESDSETDDDDSDAQQETYEEKFLSELVNLREKRSRNPPTRLQVNNSRNPGDHCLLTESLASDIQEPRSARTALKDNNWCTAMQSEMSSLYRNDTWELVPRPVNKNIVGSRWVFKVKPKPDGTVDRYKARLVAQGFSQVQGLDYSEVFSPVVRYAGFRSLLAFANVNDLEVHQMDVTTAFLHGELDHEIYMEQPEGFVDEANPTHVCKLKKSLYGLKQSARLWNSTLTQHLLSDGYKKSSADECIFIKTAGKNFVILAVYVDDVIPVSNNTQMMEEEKLKLMKKFEMVDKGPIHYVLGMVINRDRESRTLTISQPEYLRSILARFNMDNCNPVATPLEVGRNFRRTAEDEEKADISLYQQAIGCLTYASLISRPDIAVATRTMAQYMSNPSRCHWS